MSVARIVQLVLFTRPQCSLCETAKQAINNVRKQKDLGYVEIDVLQPAHSSWKAVYEFDTPVLHVQKLENLAEPADVPQAHKLFHRFNEQEIMDVIDKVR